MVTIAFSAEDGHAALFSPRRYGNWEVETELKIAEMLAPMYRHAEWDFAEIKPPVPELPQ